MSDAPRAGPSSKPPTPQQRQFAQLILSFYLPSMLVAFSDGLLVPVLPLYARSLQASYGLIGLVSAGVGLGTLVGDIPGGMLVRRLGQKRAMLVGVGCTALATIALFWARSIPEVVAYRLLAGFGQALYGVARHAYIAAAARVGVRGRAIALLGGIFRVGRFLGPLAGGTIAQAYGLRMPFLAVGGACVGAWAMIVMFVRAPEDPSQRSGLSSGPKEHSLPAMMRAQLKVLVPAGVGQLFAQMIRAGRAIVIPLYAADVVGLDVQAIGLIVSLSSAIDMLFFYPAGLIMDHMGRKWAIVPSFLLQAIGMSLVSLTGSFTGLLLAATLIGIGNGLGSGSMMTLGADLAPKEARSEFLGLWRLIGDVGTSGGPLVVGAVAEAFALPLTALIMGGAGLLSGAVFGLLMPETLRKPKPATGLAPSGD